MQKHIKLHSIKFGYGFVSFVGVEVARMEVEMWNGKVVVGRSVVVEGVIRGERRMGRYVDVSWNG